MSEISDKILDYIVKTAIQATPPKPHTPTQVISPKYAPKTTGQLPQFGLVARARAEQQSKQQLVPIKHRELVHDKKTGKVYYRTRTMYMRPEDMREADPRTQLQGYSTVESIMGKILNTGVRQTSLDDIDALIARFKNMKGGQWPRILEKLMQLRVVMKKKDWRTSEWLLQTIMSITRNSRAQLSRYPTSGQQQPTDWRNIR